MKRNLHLKINKNNITDFVLLAGDPARLDIVASYLKKPREIFYQREFRVIKGEYQGVKLLAVSTGIGSPSAAIAVEELIKLGVKVLIRIGTCGGAWQSRIKAGSVIIPTACIREDGTSQEYFNLAFPAVADFQIVNALVEVAKARKIKFYVGINRTHDAFYGNVGSKLQWQKTFINLDVKKSPILSSDMETAILFVIAALRGVNAGAILAVNADSESLMRANKKNPVIQNNKIISQKIIGEMIKIALESLKIYQKSSLTIK